VKLTKIESYEIQAFAFRVMTGYMAPGKDSSPLADEAPYEERCAAWDEWRNKYAHCILAMLHGFEALIDRDDEPTGALLDRLRAAEAEVERLRHDIERHIAIASEHATECERLRAELAACRAEIAQIKYGP
jgi:peptidoglycan hydrolase CwlO-like protein